MKKISKTVIVFIAMVLVLVNVVCATYYEENLTAKPSYRSSMSNSDIDIQSLRYEPYPVNPGEYFTLWIKAENMGNEITKDAVFELVPEFPFSLDANEDPIRRYGTLDARAVVLEYKIRVDKNAVEGANDIKLKYDPGGFGSSGYVERTFNITVENVQTDFDLVAQEMTGNDISIAVANTGENPAYSVIVKLPDQENFDVVGTNGQMVGNLDDGEYTLVGFSIRPKQQMNFQGNKTRANQQPQFIGNPQTNPSIKEPYVLNVQIDYTDTIGDRRTIIRELNLKGLYSSSSNSTSARSAYNGNRTSVASQSIYQKWWFWAIIIIVAFALWKGFKLYKKRKDGLEAKNSKNK